jgi:hypothetical protein
MLFAEPVPVSLSSSRSLERQALVDYLLDDFRRTFSGIEFMLIPEFRFFNAQALLLGSRRLVKLYGGLAFHEGIGKDALAFALLHETGHHVSTGPRLTWNPWLACECVSDVWAVHEGAEALHQRTGYKVDILKAVEQLDRVICQPTELGRSHTELGRSHTCWALSWLDRKTSIVRAGPNSVREHCPLGELMTRAISPKGC